MSGFIDTHCHLNLPIFQNDLADVIARATREGINRIIVPGIDLETSRQAVQIAEKYPQVYAAIGCHPHEAENWNSESEKDYLELVHHPRVVAIGEIGFDKYRNYASPKAQEKALRDQLQIACQVNLPVILHSRNAVKELLDTLKNHHKANPTYRNIGVFHALEATGEILSEITNLGYFIGIGGPVTYKNSIVQNQVLPSLAIESIILETDAPYLPPVPHRGERNEPSYIKYIAATIAEQYDKTLEEVAVITTSNANLLFTWNHSD